MTNASRYSILLAAAYLLSSIDLVYGVCSDKFRECIKTLEKTEDKQKPYRIYPFTRENFEDFVYETWNTLNIEYDEEHGHAHFVDNVEVEKIKYDKLDEELKAVYEETYTQLNEAYGDNICNKCDEGFNLHDLFLHENTELVRDFCSRVQIHKGVCIPAVNTGYSIEYSQPIEEIIPRIVEMSNSRVKNLESRYGKLDAEVNYDEHDCLDEDSENENNKCAIVYTKFTGGEIYDKAGLSSSNINRDVINEIEKMINEEAFEHILSGTSSTM